MSASHIGSKTVMSPKDYLNDTTCMVGRRKFVAPSDIPIVEEIVRGLK